MSILQTPHLKAILFDVDGTLFRHSPLRRAIVFRMLRHFCLNPGTAWPVFRALSAYRRAQEQLRRRDAHGDLKTQQLQLAAEICNLPPEWIRTTAARWMEEEPLSLLPAARRPGLTEFLKVARQRGIKLAVCSDYPPHEKLRVLGVAEYFDGIVCAQDPEVGRFKPDPRMLHVALERLGETPRSAVFIGDRADVDGLAAQAAGVPFVLIGGGTGYKELLREWDPHPPSKP